MPSRELGKPCLLALLVGAAVLVGGAQATAGAAESAAHTTSTTVACVPAEGAFELPRTCKATVTDTSPEPTTPTGEILFPGAFRCALMTVGPTSAACSVRGRAEAPGSFLVETTYLGDGSHTSSSGTTTLVFGAPSSPPESGSSINWSAMGVPSVKLLEAPPKKSHSRTATFRFSAEKFAVRFECRVDKGSFKVCTSPFVAKVAPGRHTFWVQAVSASGAYRHPYEYRWTVLR